MKEFTDRFLELGEIAEKVLGESVSVDLVVWYYGTDNTKIVWNFWDSNDHHEFETFEEMESYIKNLTDGVWLLG